MKKAISVFFVFLSISKFIYSQDSEEPSVPIHIVRIDILKLINCRFHFDYERFNGKRGALKIGVGRIYPNFLLQNSWVYRLQYNGYEFDVQRKFYLRAGRGGIYLAPVFLYSYKYCDQEEYYEGGGGSTGYSSSYAIWDWITAKINSYSVVASFGFVPIMHKGLNIELSAGLGVTLNDINRTITPIRYTTSLKSDHFIEYSPKVQIGAAIGFGIKGKSKKI